MTFEWEASISISAVQVTENYKLHLSKVIELLY